MKALTTTIGIVVCVPAFLLGAYYLLGTASWRGVVVFVGLAIIYVILRVRPWDRY